MKTKKCNVSGSPIPALCIKYNYNYVDYCTETEQQIDPDIMLDIAVMSMCIVHKFEVAKKRGKTPTEKDYAILSAATNRIRDAYFYAKSLK
jgi:hypothetical protein